MSEYRFKPGDKAVCNYAELPWGKPPLKEGDVHTVKYVNWTSNGNLCIQWLAFEGVGNEDLESSYDASHFELHVEEGDEAPKFMPDDEVWSVGYVQLEHKAGGSFGQTEYTKTAHRDADLGFRVEAYFADTDEVKLFGYDNKVPANKFELVRRGDVVVDKKPERPFKVGDKVASKAFLDGFEGASYGSNNHFQVTEVGPDGMLLLDLIKGYVHPNLVQLREPAKPNDQSVQLGRIAAALETLVRSK